MLFGKFGKKRAPVDEHPAEGVKKADKADAERVKKLSDILKRRQAPQPARTYPKFAIAPQKIIPMPPGAKEATYPLLRPYAYANIARDTEGRIVYTVVEPQLTDEDHKILAHIKEGLIQILDVSLTAIKNKNAVLEILEDKIHHLLSEFKISLSDDQYLRLMYYIYRDFVGLNELEPLLRDPYIEDISCLPSFERVLIRKDGKIKLIEIGKLIDENVGLGEETKIVRSSDIEIPSFDPETLKVEFKPVEALIRRENREGYFLRIRTEGGNIINTSPDHPVLVLEKSGIVEKPADKVEDGDYLLSLKSFDIEGTDKTLDLIEAFADSKIDIRVKGARSLLKNNKMLAERLGVKWYDISNWKQSDSMPLGVYLKLEPSEEQRASLQISAGQGVKNWIPAIIKVDEEFAEFIGLFLAEGHFGASNIQLSFGKHESVLCERVVGMARKIFGCTSRIMEKETSLVVYCGGKILQALFEEVLGVGRDSYTKKIPSLFFTAPENVRKALIKGIWVGDGYIRYDDRVRKAVLATASLELAWDVRFILKSFGVSSHLHARDRRFANTWEVWIEHDNSFGWMADLLGKSRVGGLGLGTSQGHLYPNFLFDLDDYNGTDRKLVGRAIRTNGRLGLKFALESSSKMIQALLTSNLHPSKVIGKEVVEYAGPFYDFKMKANPNFMHGDFIFTHNCDGTAVPLYIVHQRFGQIRTNVAFQPDAYLKEFVVKLAERCDRYVSYAEPLLDGSLPDGTRVQASLASDVTTHGPTFSIRKFREKPFTPIDQFNMKTADLDVLAYLWFLVEHGANILVCGATASGKTSFLNSLAFFMPPDSKVVSIEDTREINIYHENWLPAVARLGFAGTRIGEVTMYDLLKEAFRQNPSYLIVGEVRGEEAAVMFQAMASGITSMSTMHAGSIEDAMKRLQTRPISLPPTLLETLDVVIIMAHAIEKGAAARRVRNVIEVESVDPETSRVKYSTAYEWNPAKDIFVHKKDSIALRQISEEKGIPIAGIVKEIAQRKRILEWLAAQPLDWKAVSEHIILYYRDREKLLALMAEKKQRTRKREALSVQVESPIPPRKKTE